MKKIFLFIGVITLLLSCDEPTQKSRSTGYTYGGGGAQYNIEIIILDGCEYIGSFRGSNNDWGAHKGDCKNPIHRVRN
jgi:hypothetical protein